MRKFNLVFFVMLLCCKISGFSQDTVLCNGKYQLSIGISIPRDYNMRMMTPIFSETMIRGYSVYNKLGAFFTVEYLKQITSNLFFRGGLGFSMSSSYTTAKGNETLVLHQYTEPLDEKCLYELYDNYISGGILVGIEYLLNNKSSVSINVAPKLMDIDIYKKTDWNQEVDNNTKLLLFRNPFFVVLQARYCHLIYKKISFLLNTTIYSDNLSIPYIGTGLTYKF